MTYFEFLLYIVTTAATVLGVVLCFGLGILIIQEMRDKWK